MGQSAILEPSMEVLSEFKIEFKRTRRKCRLVPTLTLLLLAVFFLVQSGESVCVWEGSGGFKLACGFRQSGLFRIRSLGGVKGWAGAGFTIGDEDGFKDSLSNSDKRQQVGQQHPRQQQNQQQFWLQPAQQQKQSDLVSLNNLPQQQQSLWPSLLSLGSQVDEQKVLKPDSLQSLVPVEQQQQGKTSVQKRSSYWNWPPNNAGPVRGRQPNVAHKQGYPVSKVPGKPASPFTPLRNKNPRNKFRPQNNRLRSKAPGRVPQQSSVAQTPFRPMPYGQWNGQVPPRLMQQQKQLLLPHQHRIGLPYSSNVATLPGVQHTHHLSPQLLAEVQNHKAKLQMQQMLNANYEHANVGLEEPGYDEVAAVGYDTNVFPDIHFTTTTPKNKLTPLQKQLLEAEAQVKIKNGKRKKFKLIKESGGKRAKLRRTKPLTTTTFRTTEKEVTENDISSTTEESSTKSFRPSEMDVHRYFTSALPEGTEQIIDDGHKPEEHQDVFSWYNVLKSMASDDDRIRALQILQSMSLPSTSEASTTTATTTPKTTTSRTTTTTASPFPGRNLINPLLVKGYDPRFPPSHPVNRIILRDMTTTTTTTPKTFFNQNNYYNPQNHFVKTGKSRFGHDQQNRVPPQRRVVRPSQERFSYYELDSKETLDRINLTRAYNNRFYNHYNKSTVQSFGVSPKIADIYWIHAATTQRSKQFPVPPVKSQWTGVTDDDLAFKRWKLTTTTSTTPKTAGPELQVLEHESESTEHTVLPNKNRFQNWHNFKKDDRLGSSGSVNFVTDDNFQKHSSEKISSAPTTSVTSEPTTVSTSAAEIAAENTTKKSSKRVPIIRRFRTSTASTTSTTSTTTEATTLTTDDDLETTSKRQRGHRRRFKFRTYPPTPTTSTTTQTTESVTIPRRGDVDLSKSSEHEPNLLPELSLRASSEIILPTGIPSSNEREQSTSFQDFGPTKPSIFLPTMPAHVPHETSDDDQGKTRSSTELGTTEKEFTKSLSEEETKSVSHEGQDQRLLYVTSVPYQVTEKNSIEQHESLNKIQNPTDDAEEQEDEDEEKVQIVPVQVKSSAEKRKPIPQEYEPQQKDERKKLKISTNTINSVEMEQQSELSIEQVGTTPPVPTQESGRKPPVFTKILQHLITPIRDGQGHNQIINGFNPANTNRQSALTPAVNNYKQQVNRLTARIQEANQGQFSGNGVNFLKPVMKLYNVEPLLPHPNPTVASVENTQDLNAIDLQGNPPTLGPSSQFELLGPFPMPDDQVAPAPPPALQRPELTQFHEHKLRIANLMPTSTFRPTQPAPRPTPTVQIPQQQNVQVYSWSAQPEEYETAQNAISRLGYIDQQIPAQRPSVQNARRPLPAPAESQHQQNLQQYFSQQHPAKQEQQHKMNQVNQMLHRHVGKPVDAQKPVIQQYQYNQQPPMSVPQQSNQQHPMLLRIPQPQPQQQSSMPQVQHHVVQHSHQQAPTPNRVHQQTPSRGQQQVQMPNRVQQHAVQQPHSYSMPNRVPQKISPQHQHQPIQQPPVPPQTQQPQNNHPEPSMVQQPSIQIYEHTIVAPAQQSQPSRFHQPGLQQWPAQRHHHVSPVAAPTQHYYQQVPQGPQVYQPQQSFYRPLQPVVPQSPNMFNQKFGFHPQPAIQNAVQFQPSVQTSQTSNRFHQQIPPQTVWHQQPIVVQTSARPPLPTPVVHTQAELPPAQPLPPTPSDRLSPPLPIPTQAKTSGSQVDSYTLNSLMQSRMKQKEAQEAEWRRQQQEAWEMSQKFQDLNEPKEIQIMSEKEAESKLASLISQQPNRSYTSEQMDKIKKIIALHQLEKSLKKQSSTNEPSVSADFSKTVASISSSVPNSKKRPGDRFLSNMLVRKSSEVDQAPNSIDSQVPPSAAAVLAEASEHRDTMVVDIPTADLLKALAMKNGQSNQHIQNSQPSQQQEGTSEFTEATAAVDLSSILAFPKQIRMKFSEQKNEKGMPLLQVRNAPKSFYPGESPLDFDTETKSYSDFQCKNQDYMPGLYADPNTSCQVFHLCAKTDKGHMQKSFRCPKNTIFDQEVLRCNWSLYVECGKAPSKYQVNKYLSESFQFLRALGQFSSSYEGKQT